MNRLPCGCIGECDSRAHDTAWDWDGTPSKPDWSDLTWREQEIYIREHPYCQDCGDDLSEYDIEMAHRFCAGCSEKPNDRCVECGNRCPEGDEICGHCAAANRDVESAVNERMED